MKPLENLSPRDYQNSIFETSKDSNTLVVLPTGLGKTLISLMLSVHRLTEFPGSKVLMLAPTRPLVEQHLKTFKENLPELFASIEIFTGSVPAKERKSLFQKADIIFSTPQCISNDLKKCLYDLSEVSLLIEDEAHRCLKNYAYTQVVQSYKNQSENPRILGLTASPGSEPKTIKEICTHLNIEAIESRTRDSPDVKPYLQELDFQKIEVPFPQEFQEIKVLLERIYNALTSKLKSKGLIFGPANKINLLKAQAALSKQISQKNPMAFYGISLTAQAIKISHALELLETQTLASLNSYLSGLQEQANQKKSKAVQNLVKNPEFNAAIISLQALLTKKIEHPKIEELKTIIEEEIKQNPKSKSIIFTQFRESAILISQVLNKIPNISAKTFVGQTKRKYSSGASGLSQKEQKEIISEFSEGKINTLVATSIGEEGLDIPEVSSVIFYESIPSAIRSIQRRGRTARLAPGKLILLVTQNTRDVAYHYASRAREKKMHSTLENMKEDLKNKKKNPTLHDFK